MARSCKVMKCVGCKEHEFQDEKYGKDMRLHNPSGGAKSEQWTCTVCGKKK